MKLKPCPFCGHSGEWLTELWDRFDAGHIAHVHCQKCGADGPSMYGEVSAQATVDAARAAWQLRKRNDGKL